MLCRRYLFAVCLILTGCHSVLVQHSGPIVASPAVVVAPAYAPKSFIEPSLRKSPPPQIDTPINLAVRAAAEPALIPRAFIEPITRKTPFQMDLLPNLAGLLPVTFDYYISTSGSDSNPGTLASPWALTAINTKQATYAGKRVGILPGNYPVSTASSSYTNPALKVNGAVSGATYVGTSNVSGLYAPRTAVLDAHSTIVAISAISKGVTTTVTVSSAAGSNPFTSGSIVALNLVQGMTQINGLYLTAGTLGGSSGAWTFTVNNGVGGAALDSSGFGSYTSGGWASQGYPTVEAAIIGQGNGAGAVTNPGKTTLDGLIITGSYEYGIDFYPQTSPTEGGAAGITIQNCEVWDLAGYENDNVGGILLWHCTGALVTNCKIHQCIPTSGNVGSQDSACVFSFACHQNIYEYLTLYNGTVGMYDKNQNNGGHTLRYSYIESVTNTGNPAAGPYALYALTDCMGGQTGDTRTVHHCILIGRDATWNAVTAGQTLSNENLLFYNNTCYFNGSPATGGPLLQSNNANGITIYNNIFGCTGTQNFWGDAAIVATHVALSDYNCFMKNSVGQSSTGNPTSPTTHTLAVWNSNTGFDAHSVTGQCTFVSATGLNPTGYKLQSGSIGQGTGSTDGTISGSACDMGAWGGASPPSRIGCDF